MKKSIIIITAALAAFAACSKEQAIEQPATKSIEISATVEQQVDNSTKSSLSGTSVVWTANDQINVFTDAATPEKLTLALTGGAGTTSGKFATCESCEGTVQYAIYPAAADNSISGSTITFTLPATQTYAENSFGQDANVAVGTVSGSSIAFKNVCGVLKLQLEGNFPVEKIVLKTKGSEKLCGTFTVDAASAESTGAAWSADGADSLTLNCVTAAYPDGVQLSAGGTTAFNIVVPVNALTSGLVAKIYSTKDWFFYTEINTTKSNQIKRSLIKAMPACTILPPAYQKLASLTSEQSIYTGLTPSDYDTVEGSTPVVRNDSVFLSVGNSETLSTVIFKKGGNIVHHFVPCYLKIKKNLYGSQLTYTLDGMYDIYSTSNNMFDGLVSMGLNCGYIQATTAMTYVKAPGLISEITAQGVGVVGFVCTVLEGHTYSWNNPISFTPPTGMEFGYNANTATLYEDFYKARDKNNAVKTNIKSPYTAPCNGVLIIGRYASLDYKTPWTVDEGSDLIQMNEGSAVSSYQRPAFFHDASKGHLYIGSESYN